MVITSMGVSVSRLRLFGRGEESLQLASGGSESSSSSTPSMNGVSSVTESKLVREEPGDESADVYSPVKRLPSDLLLKVFSLLDVVSKCRCAQVCRVWHSLALDGSNWQSVDLFDFQTNIQGAVVVQLSKRCGGFLRQLNLRDCRSVEDAALITFAKHCRNIQHLCLRNCFNITDKTTESISKYCKDLQVLDLSSCRNISNKSCTHLRQGCHKLESVDLSYCTKITNEGVSQLAEFCPQLKTLILNYCVDTTDLALRCIGDNCHKLQHLRIRSCRSITDAGVLSVCENCDDLQRLDVAGCDRLTDATLHALGSNCKHLRILEAAECSQFTDTGFKALAEGCSELQRLDLEDCTLITDNTLMYFSQLCPHLHSLVLSHCERITDEGVRHLVGGLYALDDLQELELDNCPLVTDTSLELLWACTTLRRLEVFDCQHISRGGIDRLKHHLPRLHVQAYFAPSAVESPPNNPTRTVICRCCTIL